MRIVLTNIGQQEINKDIKDNNEVNNNQNYKSEQKNYRKKYLFSLKTDKITNIKRFNQNKIINHNISHILTEDNYLYKNNFTKENSSSKINHTLQTNYYNNNNKYKIINISSKYSIPKEIKMLYSLDDKKNDEYNKNEKEDKTIKNIIKDVKSKSISDISLPLINNSLQLKDILQTKNSKNVNHNILYKKINQNEKNLVNYLKSNKTIKPSFMEKINRASDKKLVKLDKICQKYFDNEKRNENMKQNIKDRIKLEYSNDSKFCRKELLNMGKNIQNYKHIYKSLADRKMDFLEKRYYALYLLKK